MTREEAIEILESIDNDEVDEEFAEAYNKAIKALEQQPILDKIKAEVEQYSLLTRERVIGIIDKHKAESEEV